MVEKLVTKMKKEYFDDLDSWMKSLKDFGYDFGSWGICGSKSAYDYEGVVVGEFLAPFDTFDGRETGWLRVPE